MTAAGTRRRRGGLEGAASPHPLAEGLPAIFRAALDGDEGLVLGLRGRGLDHREIGERLGRDADHVRRLEIGAWAKLGLRAATPASAADRAAQDRFLEDMCAALDRVLAPVFVTLDSLDAYVDPSVTPDDFLAWLGDWVAVTARLGWPEDAWRQLIGEAAWLFSRRGTAAALAKLVELYTGGEVEVDDPGGSEILHRRGDTQVIETKPEAVVVRVRGGRVQQNDATLVSGLDELVRSSTPAHLAVRVEVLAA